MQTLIMVNTVFIHIHKRLIFDRFVWAVRRGRKDRNVRRHR